MARHAQRRHKRAAYFVGFCLIAEDPALWNAAAGVLNRRLTRLELASLAFAALRAMEPEDREAVFNAAQWGVA